MHVPDIWHRIALGVGGITLALFTLISLALSMLPWQAAGSITDTMIAPAATRQLLLVAEPSPASSSPQVIRQQDQARQRPSQTQDDASQSKRRAGSPAKCAGHAASPIARQSGYRASTMRTGGQHLPGPLMELSRHPVQLRLSDCSQIEPFEEVLRSGLLVFSLHPRATALRVPDSRRRCLSPS